jgi:hypothetical protein
LIWPLEKQPWVLWFLKAADVYQRLSLSGRRQRNLRFCRQEVAETNLVHRNNVKARQSTRCMNLNFITNGVI